MTKEEIMDCITKNTGCSYIGVGKDNIPIESTRCYQFGVVEIKNIADELLERIEQDKKEMAREIMCWFSNETEKAFGKNYLAERIAKEYGVEL